MWAIRAAMLLIAWSSQGGGAVGTGPAAATGEAFRDCRNRPFTSTPAEKWRHKRSSAVALMGDAHHSAQDVIAAPGARSALPGKFAYGPTSKDLEDEKVHVWLDDCATWRDLGEALTDGDGRVDVDAPLDLRPGVYEARFEVRGDGSTARSFLWVLPAGTRVIVTDVDATLTKSDAEVFRQILDGSHVPVPYPGAVDLAAAHAGAGYVMVYLTGRPYWLADKTREWLTTYGFPAGPTHFADSNADILPSEDSVGAYKEAWLDGLVRAGYAVDYAYGNAQTDVTAYKRAGIPADRVWIIGEHRGRGGTNPVQDSWTERVAQVRALPKVVQPFTR